MASPKYTLKEIAKHDGVEQATVWIIINNKVYDVTKYMDEHPGGKELIMEHAGKDATKDFKNVGHSGYANKLLKKYLIGELDEDDKINNEDGIIMVEDKTVISQKRSIFCCC